MTALLLAVSFALIIGGALLFTNAVEWAGRRLGLGHGAVGSLIAAVSTALPESAIPIVAIVGGGGQNEEIAIGSIVGAPFLLGTLAMAMVGASALAFAGRRDQGREIAADAGTAGRDLVVFASAFSGAIAVGALLSGTFVRYVVALLLVAGYAGYVWWTVRAADGAEEEPEALYFDWSKQDPPSNVQIAIQFVLALAAIVGGAHLFVEEIKHLAETLGVGLLLLSLVLAPLATELPEKANSVLWIRNGKDTLALGNITGAMVFQASIPVAVGLVFTSWSLATEAVVAGVAGVIGGLLAAWRLASRDFGLRWVGAWSAAWLGFVVYAAA